MLSAELNQKLAKEAKRLGLDFNDDIARKLDQYTETLLEWNKKINLTALRDKERIVSHHFIDCFEIVAKLPALPEGATCVDVGSGAGFPGMICAIFRPSWHFTLVERIQKKAAFLSHLSYLLKIPVTVIAQDIDKHFSLKFDVVLSRATFAPQEWLFIGEKLANSNGSIFAMVGAEKTDLESPPNLQQTLEYSYEVGSGMHKSKHWLLGWKKK